jgi:hypothetical protein
MQPSTLISGQFEEEIQLTVCQELAPEPAAQARERINPTRALIAPPRPFHFIDI